ncbi:MAG: AAA family ATPase [Armatimonadota bacterium]|nr:AAA family ATPase [Armatimonadota bacterium]
MKIQLQSLRVINCGPLRDVCIHFNTDGDSPVTLLAGANGSGKTTALELIVGLAEMLLPLSELPPVRPTLLRADYAQLDFLVDRKNFSVFHGNKPDTTNLPGNSLGRIGTIGTFRQQQHGHLPGALKAQINQQETYTTVDSFSDAPNDSEVERPPLTVPSLLFFPHTRLLLTVTGDQMYKEAVAYQWVYFYQVTGQFKGSLDSYLVWLDYVEPDAYAKAIQFLNDLDIDGKIFSMSRRDFKVVVETPNGGKHFLEGMSSGEQSILILLLELRRRLVPHSIVLIDEIEISLHPAFQHRIVNGLKRLQEMIPFQLIVTSHSPTILEAFGTQSARILTQF